MVTIHYSSSRKYIRWYLEDDTGTMELLRNENFDWESKVKPYVNSLMHHPSTQGMLFVNDDLMEME